VHAQADEDVTGVGKRVARWNVGVRRQAAIEMRVAAPCGALTGM